MTVLSIQSLKEKYEHLPPIVTVGQWGGYENGRIPLSALTAIQGSYLRPDAASSMLGMQAGFKRDTGDSLTFNEGYRDYATQEYYWDQYQHHGGPPAARPGTSNHGWALAVDFNITNLAFDWLRVHAAGYGWDWSTGHASGERWHWEYILTGNNPSPPPHTSSGDEYMSYSFVKDARSDAIFVCSLVTGKRVHIATPYHVGLLQRYKVNNANDPMLIAELDIIASYLSQIGH
ncbi:M15 family metallopeptidase [Serratia fonticola]|uniref:M15 family metallopeptidase n=1 Tax=Serratia fonticola TaxID=47917 RepID=UPI00301D807B